VEPLEPGEGEHGPKYKPIEGKQLICACPICAPNGIVAPVNPDATLAILSTHQRNGTRGCARRGMRRHRYWGHCLLNSWQKSGGRGEGGHGAVIAHMLPLGGIRPRSERGLKDTLPDDAAMVRRRIIACVRPHR
jgi:hypothetical protein